MSADGILDSGNVIYYHDLDTVTEHTLNQAWSGDPNLVPGKLGSGNSALAPTDINLGPATNDATDGQDWVPGRHSLLQLDSSKFLIAHSISVGSVQAEARIGTVSGLTVTWGTATQRIPGNQLTRAALLTSTSFVQLIGQLNTLGTAAIGTISGTSISFGPAATFADPRPGGGLYAAVGLTANKFVVSWENSGAADGLIRVGEEASGVITYGSIVQHTPNITREQVMLRISDTEFLLVYRDDGAVNPAFEATVGTVSGNTVTLGSTFTVESNIGTFTEQALDVKFLDGNRFMVMYQTGNSGGTNIGKAKIATISGTSISFGPAFTYSTNVTTSYIFPMAASKMSNSVVVINYMIQIPDGAVRAKIATISGDTITFGSEQFSIGSKRGLVAVGIDNDDYMLLVKERFSPVLPRTTVNTIVQDPSELSATVPAAYPEATGLTKIVSALWTLNPTEGGAVVNVRRDYDISLNPASIDLGGASFGGSGVLSLLAALNDNFDHLLVLDFEHQSGTTWKLRTSFDGLPYVDQGDESGEPLATSNLTPFLSISNPGGIDQWIDEVVIWGGNPDTFTSDELSNLHSLANDGSGLPMPSYSDVFAEPPGPTGPPSGIECSGVDVNAEIDPTVTSGSNLIACSGSEVHKNTVLGDNVALGELVNVHKDVVLGDNVVLRNSSVVQKDAILGSGISFGIDNSIGKEDCLADNITIGDTNTLNKDVSIGSNVTLGDNNTINKDTRICNDTIIGSRNTISKGVHIGDITPTNENDCPLDCEGGVVIGDDNQIGNAVKIGKNVVIGNNVGLGRNVTLGDGVFIGDDVEIKKGESIPAGAIIGYSYLFHYKMTKGV